MKSDIDNQSTTNRREVNGDLLIYCQHTTVPQWIQDGGDNYRNIRTKQSTTISKTLNPQKQGLQIIISGNEKDVGRTSNPKATR